LKYIKYLSCICGVGVEFFGLQSFCWVHYLWMEITLNSIHGSYGQG